MASRCAVLGASSEVAKELRHRDEKKSSWVRLFKDVAASRFVALGTDGSSSKRVTDRTGRDADRKPCKDSKGSGRDVWSTDGESSKRARLRKSIVKSAWLCPRTGNDVSNLAAPTDGEGSMWQRLCDGSKASEVEKPIANGKDPSQAWLRDNIAGPKLASSSTGVAKTDPNRAQLTGRGEPKWAKDCKSGGEPSAKKPTNIKNSKQP